MRRLLLFGCVLLGLGLPGIHCAPRRYAAVSVESVDALTQNGVSVSVYSGTDSSFLGFSNPLFLHFTTRSRHPDRRVSILVEDSARGIPFHWRFFDVGRWAASPTQAMDAAYLNRCIFEIHRCH